VNLLDVATWLGTLGVGGALGALAGLTVAGRRVLDQAQRVETALARLRNRPEADTVRDELRILSGELEALRRAAELAGRAFRRR